MREEHFQDSEARAGAPAVCEPEKTQVPCGGLKVGFKAVPFQDRLLPMVHDLHAMALIRAPAHSALPPASGKIL